MADPLKSDKENETGIPDGFPQNVNPSKENIKAFNDQRAKDQKAADEGKPLAETARVGEGVSQVTAGETPAASDEGQSKTVNK